MGEAKSNILMAATLRESGFVEELMDLEFILIKMGVRMRAFGWMMCRMGMDWKSGVMAAVMKELFIKA
jgi:hypothetical protein